jgi:hypothetical protein
MTITDETLLAHLVEALDPGLAQEVREEVAASRELTARAAFLAARLRQADDLGDAWDLPPVGVPAGRKAFSATVAGGMVMGEGELAVGDRFSVWLGVVEGASERIVVVLLRRPVGWGVVFPARPDELMRVDELPLETSGARRVELVVQAGVGSQRWAVALPPATLPIAWEAEPAARWAALRAGVADGSVPVTSVQISVG